MRLDWSAITGYAISGAIVSWPVFIAGLWFSHRRARQHVEQVTEQQTGDVRKITDAQTASLVRRLTRAYQQHAQGEQGPAGQGEGGSGEQGSRPEDRPEAQGPPPGA